MHGKASEISVQNKNPLFSGLPEKVVVGRYHSLISDRDSLPACLEIIAADEEGEIMAFAHKEHPTYGVQFHPESILTECGPKILGKLLRPNRTPSHHRPHRICRPTCTTEPFKALYL